MEILEIIKKFKINIEKFKKYKKHYDIIFMIDIKNNNLYYDCYDYINNINLCKKI